MDLCSSFLTLSGAVVNTSGATLAQKPAHDCQARARAAREGGFASMGLADADLVTGCRLDGLAVPVEELEWADLSRPDWSGLDRLMRAASYLGTVRRLHCGSAFPLAGQEAANLARIARACQAAGIACAVEPVAFGGITTLAGACQVIRDAGSPAGTGILYDTWQVGRTEHRMTRVPVSMITAVQLSGATLHPTASNLADAMNREMPGSGPDAHKAEMFLTWLRRSGYTGPVSVEAPHAASRHPGVCLASVARNASMPAQAMLARHGL